MQALDFVAKFLQPFPRELFLKDEGKRISIESPAELKDYLFHFDVFYSVRSRVDYLLGLWDRVFFDVDAHNGNTSLETARLQTQELIAELRDVGIEPVVIFSGRGYHVYILLSEPAEVNINAVKAWAREREIDGNVANSNPMARLPYSFNSRSLSMTMPVSPDDLETESHELHYNPPELLSVLFGEAVVSTRKPVNRRTIEWEDVMPLCIHRMLSQLAISGELDHLPRFVLGNFVMRAYGRDAAHRVFLMANDYKFKETEYQLNHIARNRYALPTCANIQAMGFCAPEVKCPFRPWLEPFMKEWE